MTLERSQPDSWKNGSKAPGGSRAPGAQRGSRGGMIPILKKDRASPVPVPTSNRVVLKTNKNTTAPIGILRLKGLQESNFLRRRRRRHNSNFQSEQIGFGARRQLVAIRCKRGTTFGGVAVAEAKKSDFSSKTWQKKHHLQQYLWWVIIMHQNQLANVLDTDFGDFDLAWKYFSSLPKRWKSRLVKSNGSSDRI